MALPNFLIAGAPKSGTSWLHVNLRQHPDIFIPSHEVHFFNLEVNYCRGLTWYEHHFADVQLETAIGEKTPNYMWVTKRKVSSRFGNHLPFIPRKIHTVLPDLKIIVVVRNPVERAISAVNHYRRTGQLSPIQDVDEILVGKDTRTVQKYGVFDMGRYDDHLQAFQEYFPMNQFLVLVFEEDVVKNPAHTLYRVCEFLQIDSKFCFSDSEHTINAFRNVQIGNALFNFFNPWPKSRRMAGLKRFIQGPLLGPPLKKVYPSPLVKKQLYEIFAEPNERLFKRMGRRITSWEFEPDQRPRTA